MVLIKLDTDNLSKKLKELLDNTFEESEKNIRYMGPANSENVLLNMRRYCNGMLETVETFSSTKSTFYKEIQSYLNSKLSLLMRL